MIAPKAYTDLLAEIQTVMDHGNALGMWRTVAVLHKALDVARAEQYEAMPSNPVTVSFAIGPVREQS